MLARMISAASKMLEIDQLAKTFSFSCLASFKKISD